jgi:RNA polymerase sigma factor (sigma-70 family)
MTYYMQTSGSFTSPQERARLVRLCATMTGSNEAAEDLAQETLLEAWLHLEGLRDPEKRSQWLSGIARNVCLRWGRKQGRDLAHLIPLETPANQESTIPEKVFADPFDLEIDLERKELIALLDRAMAALPPETRTALVKHYVDESPVAEIAAQLGINTSAIAMRLQRGKLALRRVLTTRMQNEIEPYGFSLPGRNAWETTRLWCEICGQHHLLGKLDPEKGSLELKCPTCCHDAGVILDQAHYPALLHGVSSYKRALSRLAVWEPTYYRTGITAGSAPCINCGEPIIIRRIHPGEAPNWYYNGEDRRSWGSEQRHGIAFICTACEAFCLRLSNGIARWSPETQQFLREHTRVHTLPEREIEVDGRSGIVTSLESITDNARLDLILDLDTYETLRVYGGGQA